MKEYKPKLKDVLEYAKTIDEQVEYNRKSIATLFDEFNNVQKIVNVLYAERFASKEDDSNYKNINKINEDLMKEVTFCRTENNDLILMNERLSSENQELKKTICNNMDEINDLYLMNEKLNRENQELKNAISLNSASDEYFEEKPSTPKKKTYGETKCDDYFACKGCPMRVFSCGMFELNKPFNETVDGAFEEASVGKDNPIYIALRKVLDQEVE